MEIRIAADRPKPILSEKARARRVAGLRITEAALNGASVSSAFTALGFWPALIPSVLFAVAGKYAGVSADRIEATLS